MQNFAFDSPMSDSLRSFLHRLKYRSQVFSRGWYQKIWIKMMVFKYLPHRIRFSGLLQIEKSYLELWLVITFQISVFAQKHTWPHAYQVSKGSTKGWNRHCYPHSNDYKLLYNENSNLFTLFTIKVSLTILISILSLPQRTPISFYY